ncbi:ATP-dependent DNA helicase [Aliikangiella coralliicola]|uniref:ATP-dependent DNA helicase n=1 Tax=Aliikangiella coralliicola TaxID=2592383 RepID=A0A545UCZ2_9GAMM|nr:ATP-dependent DNA helicase [Aliikangiella coralliicola]TQV87332.1 ATP-dependent DNA helicase [Aliikangiella coralliicola]
MEFSARTGDLLFESIAGPSSLEGIIGHQKIQKSRGEDWQPEFRLKQIIAMHGFEVTIQGRLDLLYHHNDHIIIEEIKTSYHSPEKIPETKQLLHWAQAKVYAYLYWLHLGNHSVEQHIQTQSLASQETVSKETDNQDNLKDQLPDKLDVKVTWYNLAEKETFSEIQICTISELENFTFHLLSIYLDWYKKLQTHKLKVIKTSKKLAFPFEQYRDGQHHFARQVYRSIRDKTQLIVEAPTGIGKTISTIFPSVKAMGEEIAEQIVYLTAKGSTQNVATKTIEQLQNHGLNIDYLIIQAKDKSCPCRSSDINQQRACLNEQGICRKTVGFYDRLPRARLECLQKRNLKPENIQVIAADNNLCPFELSLQMIPWASIVICDFNYYFDPMTRLSVFDHKGTSRVILIDELHNLQERAREMYSASLSMALTKSIAKQLQSYPDLKRRVQKLTRSLATIADENQVLEAPPTKILKSLEMVIHLLGELKLQDSEQEPSSSQRQLPVEVNLRPNESDMFNNEPEGLSEWIKQVYRTYIISELYTESHVSLAKVQHGYGGRKSLEKKLRIMCLDASEFLKLKLKTARTVIGFSATLNPISYYQQLTGFKDSTSALSLPAIFPPENQLTLRCDYIDTRWRNRDTSLSQLIKMIAQVYSSSPGKYLAFFPSYDYLNKSIDLFQKNYPDIHIVKQVVNSDDKQREDFLHTFFQSEQPAIGFAIMGGIFAEGVDYQGDSLNGTIVIGTGMPQPSEEQKQIDQHFNNRGLNGYQYAYQFPGFTRVQQTAGRVIRSENDRGVVVLVDPRFRRHDYQKLMPEHWRITPCRSISDITNQLREFWNNGARLV